MRRVRGLLDVVTLSNDTAMIEGTECEKEPVHLREHLQNPQYLQVVEMESVIIRYYKTSVVIGFG